MPMHVEDSTSAKLREFPQPGNDNAEDRTEDRTEENQTQEDKTPRLTETKRKQANSLDILTDLSTLSSGVINKERSETVDDETSDDGTVSCPGNDFVEKNVNLEESFVNNFNKMVEGIQDGLLCPGVVFYHESTLLDDILPDNPNALYVTRHHVLEYLKGQNSEDGEYDDDNDRSSEIAMKEQARENYGERAKELEKFYNIVKVADQTRSGSGAFDEHVEKQNLHLAQSQKTSIEARKIMVKESAYSTTDSDYHSSRPSSSRTETQHIESLSQFELRDLSTTDASVRQGSQSVHIISTSDGSLVRMQGSSAYIYAVAIWFWYSVSNSPKALDKSSSVNSKRLTLNLTQRLLPGVGVWRSFSHHVDKLRRTYTNIQMRGSGFLEVVVMFMSWIERVISHGQNKPTGWKKQHIWRPLLNSLLLFLVVLDVVMFASIGVIYFCIYDKTGCNDHSGLIVILLIWPFAIFMAPLSGLHSVILTPSGRTARRYKCWSSYVNITTVAIVGIYLQYYNSTPDYYLYAVTVLVLSRLCQHFSVDALIQMYESQRSSRGWDGLLTSVSHHEYDFH